VDVDDASGLTRRGWSLFGAAIGLLIGSRLLGTVELAMLGFAAMALLASSFVWTLRAGVRIGAGRSIQPQRTMVGEEARVDLSVVNRGARRTPILAVADVFGDGARAARFVLPPLPAGERALAAYRVPTNRRGRFAVGPLMAIVTDPFGLVRRRSRVLESDELLVRPRVHSISAPPLGGGRSSTRPGDARSLVGDGDEFLALREYEVGDDLRQVHWRSTARLDQLMIRQNEAHRQARAIVYLDVRPDRYDGASFELAVEAAASVVFRLARMRRHVELVLSTGEEIGGGVDPLLDRLAVIEPHRPDHAAGVLARRRRRALMIAIVAAVDHELATRTVELATRGPVVVVTTRAPGVAIPSSRLVDASHLPFADAWDAAVMTWPTARSSRLPARH